METIDKYVIFCAERNIFVLDTESCTHTITNVPQIARKQKNTSENDNSCTIENKNEGSCPYHLTTISKCKRLFAITSDKFLFVYEFNSELLKLISTHQLARKPSSIKFTPDSKSVLVADKTGDCYIYECGSKTEGRWILGHCSMVLDILMSECSSFIVTCDRDEKIRLTNFPQTEEIETYCLGHLEFVSGIAELSLPNKNRLVSISGDKTMRFWNYTNGFEEACVELEAPAFQLIHNDDKNLMAVSMFSERALIGIYRIDDLETGIQIKKCAEHTMSENVKYISSMAATSGNCFWLLCQGNDDELLVKKIVLTNGVVIESHIDYLTSITSSIKLNVPENISILFKKKIDNMKDYHDRKKRRLKEKKN